jgi:hypothetical protein
MKIPPAFAEAATRRQASPPFSKGGMGGFGIYFLGNSETKMGRFQWPYNNLFTPLKNPSIYAGDGRNRKHHLLI